LRNAQNRLAQARRFLQLYLRKTEENTLLLWKTEDDILSICSLSPRNNNVRDLGAFYEEDIQIFKFFTSAADGV
jgi:hypothetical protein